MPEKTKAVSSQKVREHAVVHRSAFILLCG